LIALPFVTRLPPHMHTHLNALRSRSLPSQLRPVTVPDIDPAEVVGPGLLSMCAGDFVVRLLAAGRLLFHLSFLALGLRPVTRKPLSSANNRPTAPNRRQPPPTAANRRQPPPHQDVYSAPEMAGAFDCVVTCFFIDTAHNVIEYLEVCLCVVGGRCRRFWTAAVGVLSRSEDVTNPSPLQPTSTASTPPPKVIHHVLRPGGHWVHLGPLLWHWADAGPDEVSVELPLAEVHRLAGLVGFDAVRQEFVDAAYIGGSGVCARLSGEWVGWVGLGGG
jgi:hypothetical protein